MQPEPQGILQSLLQRVKGPAGESREESAEDALARVLATALQAHADSVARSLQAHAESVTQSLQGHADAVAQSLQGHADAVARGLQGVLDQHADRVQQALREHAEQVRTRVDEAAARLAEASVSLENAAGTFRDNAATLQAVGDHVANATAQAEGLLAPLLERLDRLAWQLDTHSPRLQAQSDATAALAQGMEELRHGVEASLAAFAGQLGSLGPAVNEALQASALALDEAREALTTRLGGLAEEVHLQVGLVKEGVDSWSRLQMEIEESQAELLSVGNQRLESMNRTLGSLVEAVSDIRPVGGHLARAGEILPGLRRLLDASVASQAALAEEIMQWKDATTRLRAAAETLEQAVDGGLAQPLLRLEGSIHEAIAPLIRLVDQATDNAERLEQLWPPLVARLGVPSASAGAEDRPRGEAPSSLPEC